MTARRMGKKEQTNKRNKFTIKVGLKECGGEREIGMIKKQRKTNLSGLLTGKKMHSK
jgi:hypothetical protein